MKHPMTEARLDPGLARRLMDRLVELKICGESLSHSREANLVAIDKLLDRQPFYTLGIHSVDQAVVDGRLTKQQVLDLVCAYTKESTDLSITKGPNAIDPASCLEGLWEAAKLMRRVRDARGTIVFGAGHSGSMISCYNRLADYFRGFGCETPIAGGGTEVQKDWYLDFVGVVAVVSDTCGIHHTHMTAAMAALTRGRTMPQR